MRLLDAAMVTASENIALAELDDRLTAVLGSIGGVIAEEGVHKLLTRERRRETLLAALHAVAANPSVWDKFHEKDLVKPLVSGVLKGLLTDPSRLLSGPVLVESVRLTLTAAARRGSAFLESDVTPAVLQTLLEVALNKANEQIGKSIDAENLPDYIERVAAKFLRAPFALATDGGPEFDQLVENVLAAMGAS
jgi:hypothetical protein